MSRAGLILVTIVGSTILAIASTFIVGIVFNPVVWLIALFAKAGVGIFWLGLGAALAALYAWYMTGPWFKVLLAVTSLPALALLVTVGATLLDDGRKLVIQRGEKLLLVPTRRKNSNVVIALIGTILVYLLIYAVVLGVP